MSRAKFTNTNSMKNLTKLLMVVAVFTMTTGSFAQTKKGNFVLSGGTGLQFTSSNVKYVYDGETQEKETISSFSFVPTFAYFVMDDLAIGLTSTITSTTYKSEDGDKDKSNITMILPTAIYYFPLEGKIRPIAQIGVGLSSQSNKYIPKSGSDEKTSASGLAINFGGGVSYFVKENISINLGLSYTLVNLTDGDDNKGKMKQGNFGSNIGLAIYF
jgi:outer membrane protein